MSRVASRSTLHLQMGQETIYLLLAVALFAAFVLAARIARTEEEREPPIIQLPEAAGFKFATGSAELNESFTARLRAEIAPQLQRIGERNRAEVIEVIGHTDEVPLKRRSRAAGNLDDVLLPILAGGRGAAPLASDNIGLGMARAVAVAAALRRSGLARRFIIVPMSAGPFLKPDDTAATIGAGRPDAARRRIELRVRRRVTPPPS